MRAVIRLAGLVAFSVFVVSAIASAQATLAGVVKDTSGAVLPGVTVEAASPVLIEKVRTTVTDGTGQYSIVDLRGGTYTVTFSLTGFQTIKKDSVEVLGNAVVQMNADMRVGAVAETITVTGETPTVDLKTTTKQAVMTKSIIDSLPTSRNYNSFGFLLSGVNTTRQDSGGALGDPMASLTIHGSRSSDQRVMQNGVNTMTLQAGGDIGIAVPNPAMASEVTVDTSAVSAEQSQGGVRINYIPRDGGNMFSGTFFTTYSTNGMQADNLTDELKAKGLTSATQVKEVWDINPGFGGPIKKDRVWFFFTGRVNRADQYPANAYVNLNAYIPNDYRVILADGQDGRPLQKAYNATLWQDGQIRLTAQLNPKNKVAFTWDQEYRCSCPGYPVSAPWSISATTVPDGSGNFRSPTQRLLHAEWSSPVTNKLLVEVLAFHRTERWGFMAPTTSAASDFISTQQQAVLESGALVPILDASNGVISHGNFISYNNNWVPNYFFRGSASYVTGGHQFKFGASDVVGYLESNFYNYSPYSFVMNIAPLPGGGFAPVAVILENVRPVITKSDQNYDFGIYAQDRWTMDKWTVNLGVRFDAYKSSSPPQHMVGPTPLTPNRPDVDFPYTEFNSWKDITPRFGVTYDVTGDGKTAVKVTMNKYLQSQTVGPLSGFAGSGGLNPINRLINQTGRIWFDGNGDHIANCDLVNLTPNGECGPAFNPGFGGSDPNASQYDPNLEFGWGKRGYNWEFGASVQREILPRVSMDVGYFRRWYGNFIVTDNLALGPNDYTQFSIVVPETPGLSSSGQTVTGLFDPNQIVATQNYTTLASTYGKQLEHWNGIDFSVNARLQNGVFLFGGINTGKTMLDDCEVAAKVPEAHYLTPQAGAPTVQLPLSMCHVESPWLMQVKLNGSYTVPKVDVLLSATFQSIPGPPTRADYTVTQKAAGVPLTNGTQSTAMLPWEFPGFLTVVGGEYGDRLNQMDFRIGKVFRAKRTRTVVNFDFYNLFNRSAVTAENNRLEAFRAPTDVQLGRFFKIGAQFDF